MSSVRIFYASRSITPVFLIGSEELSPWGLIHKLPCIRHKVRSTLYLHLRNYGKSEKNQHANNDNPNIPFLDPTSSKNLSVEQRLLSLELFLKEYVVRVDNVVKNGRRMIMHLRIYY